MTGDQGSSSEKIKTTQIVVCGTVKSGKSLLIQRLIKEPIYEAALSNTTQAKDEYPQPLITMIDIQGLGDPNTEIDDARILAAAKYLVADTPSLFLIVCRFDDSRFEGENSNFTRVLQAVELIRRSTVQCHVQILVVVTHFSFGNSLSKSNPVAHLDAIKECVLGTVKNVDEIKVGVIEQAEINIASTLSSELWSLETLSGNIDSFLNCKLHDARITVVNTKSVSKVEEIEVRALAMNYGKIMRGIADTEITITLENYWAAHKLQYDLSQLFCLQKILQGMKICKLSDIKADQKFSVHLGQKLDCNLLYYDLVKNALNVIIPELSGNIIVGSGIKGSSENDEPLQPIFVLSTSRVPSVAGYTHSDSYNSEWLPHDSDELTNLDDTSIRAKSLPPFRVYLKRNINFSSNFIDALCALSPLNNKSRNSRMMWLGFFRKFGTHVIESVRFKYGSHSSPNEVHDPEMEVRSEVLRELHHFVKDSNPEVAELIASSYHTLYLSPGRSHGTLNCCYFL